MTTAPDMSDEKPPDDDRTTAQRLTELRRSNASGKHADKRTKRRRTRAADTAAQIKEDNGG
jgi:hypothetical protein